MDNKTIRKHANDVLRISQLLAPDVRIPVAAKFAQDLNRFLYAIEVDLSIDPKAIKINNSVAEIVERSDGTVDIDEYLGILAESVKSRNG